MLGLASSLLRIIFSAGFGALMLAPLDRPLLMEGFTYWDFGEASCFPLPLCLTEGAFPSFKAFSQSVSSLFCSRLPLHLRLVTPSLLYTVCASCMF